MKTTWPKFFNLDIQMSIRPLDEQKFPLDIQMSIRPLDEWTLSIGQSNVHSSIGRTEVSIGRTEISIEHSNAHAFVHWTNRSVHWTNSSQVLKFIYNISDSFIHVATMVRCHNMTNTQKLKSFKIFA